MPGRTRTFTLKDLSAEIPKIFDQVQNSTANHQKNYVALFKLHSEAAQVTEPRHRGMAVNHIGERAFEDILTHMVARMLPVKKGVVPADRIAKFLGGYTKFINEKAAEEAYKRRQAAVPDDDDESTAARYTTALLRFLLKGCTAKDKTVRHRALQVISEMIAHLGEVDEDIYQTMRTALTGRVYDKEPSVRVQAVTALSKLAGSEDPADLGDGEPLAIDILIDILSQDPMAEVRRATLSSIVRIPATLDAILARTRDTDPTVRKLVYSTVLDPKSQQGDAIAVIHPRALTIAQRETIVRNGLGDREDSVRVAAQKLIGLWAQLVRDHEDDDPEAENVNHTLHDDLILFLKMFDLSECKIAEDALLSVLTTQQAIFNELKFGDVFWQALNPEKVMLARVYVDHCVATQNDAKLEAALPVVTAVAFKIQTAYNDLVDDIQAEEEARFLRDEVVEDENREEQKADKEIVINELLKLAVNLDYTDEIGRRKMFQLVRDMISQDVLPEHLLGRCLDVLRKLSANERDLIRVVVEVVHDLRDPSDPDEPAPRADDTESDYNGTPSAAVPGSTAEKPTRKSQDNAPSEAIDLRCLSLCIGMLERVNGTFEENSTLEGILRELILPAVQSKELILREKGLVCLGLCCLIARRMAVGSFQLLLGQIQTSPEVIKIPAIQILFDILMVHEGAFLGKRDATAENILKFLLNLLGREDSPKVQALTSIGISKLVLSGMISDERALTSLLMIYLSPATVDNHELRQALSYFFPVYCYSSRNNQRCIQKIFIPSFEKLSELRNDLEEDEEMVSAAQVGSMFVDWTDPQKVVNLQGEDYDDDIHFDVASDVVKALFKDITKDDKKALCQLLGKLHLPDQIDDYKLRCLKVLMHNLNSRRPLHDTVARNAFTRFDTAVSKKHEKQLEDFNEVEYRKLEELKELFDFLDDIIPEDDEEIEINAPKKVRPSRKRRSLSVTSTSTDVISAGSKSTSRSKSKKRRISTSDDNASDSEEITELGRSPTPAQPQRTMPKRAVKKPIEVIEISDGDGDSTPPPPRKPGKPTYKVKVEHSDDTPRTTRKDGGRKAKPTSSRQSPTLVPSSDEEEMDEVNSLLADAED